MALTYPVPVCPCLWFKLCPCVPVGFVQHLQLGLILIIFSQFSTHCLLSWCSRLVNQWVSWGVFLWPPWTPLLRMRWAAGASFSLPAEVYKPSSVKLGGSFCQRRSCLLIISSKASTAVVGTSYNSRGQISRESRPFWYIHDLKFPGSRVLSIFLNLMSNRFFSPVIASLSLTILLCFQTMKLLLYINKLYIFF